MNVLANKFPTKIRIGDRIYEIDADFRNCLKIILAFEDDELTIEDKYEVMLCRLYKQIPDDIVEAVRKAKLFLDCGEKAEEKPASQRVYSFQKDGQFIYSAVKQTHQIDLEEVEFLHWWKFVFLFSDINSDCAFANMVHLRDKKNRGKLSKEERAVFNKSRAILDLNYTNEPTEEERDFLRRLKGE